MNSSSTVLNVMTLHYYTVKSDLKPNSEDLNVLRYIHTFAFHHLCYKI